MTSDQEKQFNDFGCVSRCLIKLAAVNEKPISKADYCQRFENLFPHPKERYGILDDTAFHQIVKELALPTGFKVCGDYPDVEAEFNTHGRMILVNSKINLNLNKSDPINHCSVLTKINSDGFELWTPSQDGNDYSLSFLKNAWKDKGCAGWILF